MEKEVTQSPIKRKEVIDMATILEGDCLQVLKTLPDCSVNCCVTSPPYY